MTGPCPCGDWAPAGPGRPGHPDGWCVPGPGGPALPVSAPGAPAPAPPRPEPVACQPGRPVGAQVGGWWKATPQLHRCDVAGPPIGRATAGCRDPWATWAEAPARPAVAAWTPFGCSP